MTIGDDLLLRYLLGESSPEDNRALSDALAASPDLRQRLVAYARLHGHLGEIGRRAATGHIDSARLFAVPDRPGPTRPPAPTRHHHPGWRMALGTGATLLVAGLLVMTLAILGGRTRTLVPAIATCTGPVQVQRGDLRWPLAPGDHLLTGDHLQVPPGAAATISLNGGTLAIDGGSALTVEALDGPQRRLRLLAGTVTADLRPGDPALGIIAGRTAIRLEDGRVRIHRDQAGVTHVNVARGRVDVDTPGGPGTLIAGQDLIATLGPAARTTAL